MSECFSFLTFSKLLCILLAFEKMLYFHTAVLQQFLSTVISLKAGAIFVTSIAGSKTKILRKTGSKENRGRLDVFNGSKNNKNHKIISTLK